MHGYDEPVVYMVGACMDAEVAITLPHPTIIAALYLSISLATMWGALGSTPKPHNPVIPTRYRALMHTPLSASK